MSSRYHFSINKLIPENVHSSCLSLLKPPFLFDTNDLKKGKIPKVDIRRGLGLTWKRVLDHIDLVRAA